MSQAAGQAFLVLDDLGAEARNAWALDWLYVLLNRAGRYLQALRLSFRRESFASRFPVGRRFLFPSGVEAGIRVPHPPES